MRLGGATRAAAPDAAELARRLGAETRGEVLFDAAVARPLRHRRLDLPDHAGRRVRAAAASDDVATALDIARDLKVPVAAARRAAPASAARRSARRWSSTHSKHLRQRAATSMPSAAPSTVEPGLVLDHLNAALKPHGLWFPVDVSTSAQATLGGMAGNNSCGSRSHRLRQHGAQRAGHRAPGCPTASCVDFGPVRRTLGARARDRRLRARQLADAASRRDRGALAQGAAPGRRLQPRHLPQPERAALHRRRQRQPRAPAGRQPKARSPTRER